MKIPFYDYSIDCHKNMKNAYKQGAEDMRKKIYMELCEEAETTRDYSFIWKIKEIELN